MTTTNRGRATAPTMPSLPLGQLVATPGALIACLAAGRSVVELVNRHAAGDWGELCAGDHRTNVDAVRHGLRVFSIYPLPTGERVWIITEADRASTCVLLPHEY